MILAKYLSAKKVLKDGQRSHPAREREREREREKERERERKRERERERERENRVLTVKQAETCQIHSVCLQNSLFYGAGPRSSMTA